ncbi:hypothetical protein [Methanoregula sp.]|uniref:hypothetical protein n=1 Tax=Methanoregula sp. TaxID=2052170 RepID=UPI003BAE759D
MTINPSSPPNRRDLFRKSVLSRNSRRINDFDDSNPWRILSWGWKWAIDTLMENAKVGVCPLDHYYPILFVFRQYLEIKSKELITSLELYLHGKTIPVDYFKDKQYRHKIQNLWKDCENLLIELSDSLKESDDSDDYIRNLSDFQHIGQIINELYEKDPTSETFRYPFPDKNKQFDIDMNPFSKNVIWVCNQMEEISDWIEAIEGNFE